MRECTRRRLRKVILQCEREGDSRIMFSRFSEVPLLFYDIWNALLVVLRLNCGKVIGLAVELM